MDIGNIIGILTTVFCLGWVIALPILVGRHSEACPCAKDHWYGRDGHEFEDIRARKHMDCCTDYIVDSKCKLCGEWKEKHFVSHSSLMFRGVKREDIEKIRQDDKTWYYFKKGD